MPGSLRIGEFSRRVGVSTELLRAWERRYGLLQPVRSAGGFRLYTDQDAERVAAMRRLLDDGLSAAQAARAALAGERGSGRPLEAAAADLLDAIRNYDEAGVHAVLDESLSAFALETVLRQLILPALDRIGREWQTAELDVSQEHFASNLIRGRMLALARQWGRGSGPRALLACVPGEAHDISLIAFGLMLRSYGWRIVFLGADTPLSTLAQTAEATRPALTVLSIFEPALLEQNARALRRLAKAVPLALSGPGALEARCASLGIRRLDGDLIAAAHEVAGESAERPGV